MKQLTIQDINTITLGEGISYVLTDTRVYSCETADDLLDDLTDCFWKMLPYYIEGVKNNG